MADSEADADRRSYERVSWDCHARLMQLGPDVDSGVRGMHPVLGRNLSEGGLQVWAGRMFAVRSRLLVEMEAEDIPEGIQAVGSVVWVSPSTAEERWLIGIEFSDVGDTALARIRSIVQPMDERN